MYPWDTNRNLRRSQSPSLFYVVDQETLPVLMNVSFYAVFQEKMTQPLIREIKLVVKERKLDASLIEEARDS